MATSAEILNAVKIVREAASDPVVGSVKEFLDGLENSQAAPVVAPTVAASTTPNEVRVVDVKETR